MKFMTKVTCSGWWYAFWMVYCIVHTILFHDFWSGLILGVWAMNTMNWAVPRYLDRKHENEWQKAVDEYQQRLFDDDWDSKWTPTANQIAAMSFSENNKENNK